MKIYEEAIKVFGARSRYTKLAEEAAELSVAAHHYRDNKINVLKFAEEVADVEMLCKQIRIMIGDSIIDGVTTQQMMKLRKALDEAQHDGSMDSSE